MRAFSYERAASPAEAAARAAEVPGAKFIAGGTNLLDLMKHEIETPLHLIDVRGTGLNAITATEEGGLRVGAMVSNSTLAADPRATKPPPAATCCSARAAPTFMTPLCPAISAHRALAARRWEKARPLGSSA